MFFGTFFYCKNDFEKNRIIDTNGQKCAISFFYYATPTGF